MSTLEQLKDIFEKYTETEFPDLSEDTVFTTDMVMNSCEIFGLICEVEDFFGVEIPDETLIKLVTVKDLIDFLESNTQ